MIVNDIEAYYVKELNVSSIIINVSFSINATENEELLVTLTSPDGLLTWESLALKASDGNKRYYTMPDIILPYYISGEWTLTIARSDKSITKKFTLNAPSNLDITIPGWFETSTVTRASGGVYTVVSPYLQRNQHVSISAYNPANKETINVGELNGEREKRISVPFRTTGIIFTAIDPDYSDGFIFRHTQNF